MKETVFWILVGVSCLVSYVGGGALFNLYWYSHVTTTSSVGGINFGLDSAQVATLPRIDTMEDMVQYANDHVGDVAVAKSLKQQIDRTSAQITKTLATKDSLSVNDKVKLFERASRLAERNEIYREGLKIVGEDLGASVRASSTPI